MYGNKYVYEAIGRTEDGKSFAGTCIADDLDTVNRLFLELGLSVKIAVILRKANDNSKFEVTECSITDFKTMRVTQVV